MNREFFWPKRSMAPAASEAEAGCLGKDDSVNLYFQITHFK